MFDLLTNPDVISVSGSAALSIIESRYVILGTEENNILCMLYKVLLGSEQNYNILSRITYCTIKIRYIETRLYILLVSHAP